ncbi:MAG: dockerin type I domain-containing protein [Planctomycetota bacterium]
MTTHRTRCVALALGGVLAAAGTLPANGADFVLAGDGADGYAATVGLNREGNTLAAIDRNPNNPKFFDYPAYVDPENPAFVLIMAVEPYQFGLSFPTDLHPTGPGTFAPVGTLAPIGTPGAPFIDAVTEDPDFDAFDLGVLTFDDSGLAGVGLETIAPGLVSLTLDGSDFQSANQTELVPGADAAPFGDTSPTDDIIGRSNRNEFANTVTITADAITGDGLTFVDGQLASVDLDVDVTWSGAGAALPPFPITVTGELTFDGDAWAYDVDGTGSNPIAQNVRILVTRHGQLELPGRLRLLGDANNDGAIDLLDFDILAQNFGSSSAPGAGPAIADFNGDGAIDLLDFDILAQNFGTASPAAIPEPAALATLGLGLVAGLRRRRKQTQPRRATLCP